jgi:hypothetical protein
MPQENDNLLKLLGGFAEQISTRLALADELAKQQEEETYKRDIERQDFELDRDYKRAQIGKLNRPEPEKPQNFTGLEDYATHLLSTGMPEADIMKQIGGLQGMFKPPKAETDDVPANVYGATAQNFYAGRKVPPQYNELGSKTAEGFTPPITPETTDSLMSMLSGLNMGGQGQPNRAGDAQRAQVQEFLIQKYGQAEWDSLTPDEKERVIQRTMKQ